MAAEEHPPDTDIFAELAKIDACMSELCADDVVLDPDGMMDSLQAQTDGLRGAIDALMRDVAHHPERQANINQLVSIATRDLLMQTAIPLVIRTRLDKRITELPMDREVVLAVISRGLQLAAEYSGPGSEILIESTQGESGIEIRVQADAASSLGEPTLPIKLRSISLTDMLRGLGGDVFLTTEKQTINLRLLLGVDAQVS